MQHVVKGDCGAQRGSREEPRGCKGGAKWEECIIVTKKQENRQSDKTKQQNKDVQIC